jgi:hypothetical protein
MKIAIYGDSFADPSWNTASYNSWSELLKNNCDVVNFAKEGSSLWWSYNIFLKENTNFDYNIFVGSIHSRIYVPYSNIHLNASTASWPIKNKLNLGEIYYEHFFHYEREFQINQLMIRDILSYQNTIYIPAFEESVPVNLPLVPLNAFSMLEEKYYGYRPYYMDNRKCHLTLENNRVIYEKILNVLERKESMLMLDTHDFVEPSENYNFYFRDQV